MYLVSSFAWTLTRIFLISGRLVELCDEMLGPRECDRCGCTCSDDSSGEELMYSSSSSRYSVCSFDMCFFLGFADALPYIPYTSSTGSSSGILASCCGVVSLKSWPDNLELGGGFLSVSFCLSGGPRGSDAVRAVPGRVDSSGIDVLVACDIWKVCSSGAVRIERGSGRRPVPKDPDGRCPGAFNDKFLLGPVVLFVKLDLDFSFSGGGVGGKTFLPIVGGALCSRPPLLLRPLCTRFVAAKLMFSGSLSSLADDSSICLSFCSAPANPVDVFEVAVAISRALPR